MAGFTSAFSASSLDSLFPTSGATDYVGYSANGSSETGSLARTNIGATGWSAATVADPSVKANANIITSAAASGTVTVTHFAVMSSSGTLRTDWTALAASKALTSGDKLEWAVSALAVTLT
jgi:hypothetical protein